jgi:heme exporter protein D
MYFESLSAVLQMDGHGAYVWSAYAISLLVLALLMTLPLRRRRRVMREVRGEVRRAQGSPGLTMENP